MFFTETELVQREYDKKWERIAKIQDTDNAYTFINESGDVEVLIPEKWITIAVYDFIMETK